MCYLDVIDKKVFYEESESTLCFEIRATVFHKLRSMIVEPRGYMLRNAEIFLKELNRKK